MDAATGESCTGRRRPNRGATGAGVHDLAGDNGHVDGELLKALGGKGQWVVAQHDDVGQLPWLKAAERLLLEARVGGVDGLAAQGLQPGECLARTHRLATE